MNHNFVPLNIIIMEAYDDGSHGSFLNGLIKHSRHNYVRLSLPGRKWKWRMRGSAIYFAREIYNIWPEDACFPPNQSNLIFTSDMTSVTDLKALLPAEFGRLPIICYFHENQLTYPLSEHDQIDYQYGFTNITSALATDGLWFNSQYNRIEFVNAATALLGKMPDFVPPGIGDDILAKSIIMPLGLSPELFDFPPRQASSKHPPVILWNHRWEYDKNPEAFFNTLLQLDQEKIDFNLIVAGESFRVYPEIFDQAKNKLAHKILHFGYAKSRKHYYELIRQSDIVISTAIHEFFGLAVMEAVACGCVPLLPNRLNYPYLIPQQYHDQLLFNNDQELLTKIKTLLETPSLHEQFPQNQSFTEDLNWKILAETYDKRFVEFGSRV